MKAQLAHVARVSTLGEMMAGIVHEVNQPLGAIRNFVHATNNVLAAGKQIDLEILREWNTGISKAATHAAEIVERLRGFIRRSGLKRSSCGINEIVTEASQLMAFETSQRHVSLRLEACEDDPTVHVDRVEIQQVLVNLLQNAYEATPPGTSEVTVRTRLAGKFVEVSVADNGPGLPSEKDLQIFNAFVTSKQDGLGIGLTIAKTIIETHGGSLSAATNFNGGATFLFTLPVSLAGEDNDDQ